MNIVIAYRPEPHGGTELKYTLRSIEKYFDWKGEIFIVGEKFPAWLKNVNKIRCLEDSVKSPRNILNKLIYASGIREVGERFIRWDDDLFLTKKIDSIPYWYEGNLEEAIKRHHGSYKDIITNTALKLTDSFLFYDVHTPIIMERNLLIQMAGLMWPKFLVKTTYCHFMRNFTPPDTMENLSVPIKDCKLHGPKERVKRKNEIANSLFFSTSPQAIDPEMISILNEMYLEPSKHEI